MYQTFDSDVMDDLFYEADFDAAWWEAPATRRLRAAIAADRAERERLQRLRSQGLPPPPSSPVPPPFDGRNIPPNRVPRLPNTFDSAEMDNFYDAGDDSDFDADYADPSEAEAAFRRATEIARGIGESERRQLRDTSRQARQAATRARQAIDRIFRDARQNNQFDEFAIADVVNEAAPEIARLTVNSIMPGVTNLPAPIRHQIIRSVASATRMLADRQGTQAARAIPQIVASVQQNAQQHRLPVRALPQAIRRTAVRVANSPGLARQLAQTTSRGQAVR